MQHILIAGASLAGTRTALALRSGGFSGRITVVGQEPALPYDRPPLSKQLLTQDWDPTRADLGTEQHYAEQSIDFELGVTAVSLSLSDREVLLDDGRRLTCDRLVVATGSSARMPWKPRPGVMALRTMADAISLRDAVLQQPRVVVVGGGFIGTEVAAAARSRGCEVTLVHFGPTVLDGRLDRELGHMVQETHRSQGVRLLANEMVKEIRGHDRVEEVELASGVRLAADLVVVGVGAVPNDGWLTGSGLVVGDGVHVDEYCAAVPGGEVVACGDVARFHSPVYGRSLRVEHWTNAREQAELAAKTLLAGDGRTETYRHVPYFWSHQYRVRIQQVGLFNGESDDVTAFAADGPTPRRLSLYADESGTVTGGTSVNRPELLNQVRSFIERHVPMREAAAQVAEVF